MTWNVDVYLSEEDGRTHAEAVLRTHAGTAYKIPGTGTCPRSATSSPCAAS
jgi:xanthine dehydrogenase molybdopterin-binding subunit B